MTPTFETRFSSEVVHWRGPAPFFFAAVPSEHVEDIRAAARAVSYGWGMVPCEGEVAGHRFTTALFPKDGGYLVPLKDKVRAITGASVGDTVAIAIRVFPKA